MCKQISFIMVLISVFILSDRTEAEVFYDNFNTPHNYLTEGVIGTGWDGFIGLGPGETVDALNADMNHPGELYIRSTNARWEPPFTPLGPFLYKEVAGDFIATVHVTDFAGSFGHQVLHNDSFIMARVADINAAGAGEDFECVHYFPTWVGNMGRDVNNGVESEWGFIGRYWQGDDTFALAQEYIQLERRGNIFYFRISEDGVYWESLDTSDSPFNVNGFCIERPDLAGLPLQVGLAHATYSSAPGYVAFDDFTLYEHRPVIYVDSNAAGANNGSSWENAYKYLQNALWAAGSGTDIWAAQGTYRPDEDINEPNGTDDRTATFQLKNGVAIYGGFPSGGGNWASRKPQYIPNHPQRRPQRR